jgi:nucleoid DNA-binding protein
LRKPDLIRRIAEKGNYRHIDVEAILDAFCEVMLEAATADDTVTLPGYLTMQVRERAGRTFHDVVNNKEIEKPPRKIVMLRTGKYLKAIGKE